MFGCESGKYFVCLEIFVYIEFMKFLVVRKGIYKCDSEMKDGYFGFDLVLEKLCEMKVNMLYIIKVLFDGFFLFYGCYGYLVVECGGVIFSFV